MRFLSRSSPTARADHYPEVHYPEDSPTGTIRGPAACQLSGCSDVVDGWTMHLERELEEDLASVFHPEPKGGEERT